MQSTFCMSFSLKIRYFLVVFGVLVLKFTNIFKHEILFVYLTQHYKVNPFILYTEMQPFAKV